MDAAQWPIEPPGTAPACFVEDEQLVQLAVDKSGMKAWVEALTSREEPGENSCIGRWLPADGVVELLQQRGKRYANCGFNVGGVRMLYPEEALYLLDEGALLLAPAPKKRSWAAPQAEAAAAAVSSSAADSSASGATTPAAAATTGESASAASSSDGATESGVAAASAHVGVSASAPIAAVESSTAAAAPPGEAEDVTMAVPSAARIASTLSTSPAVTEYESAAAPPAQGPIVEAAPSSSGQLLHAPASDEAASGGGDHVMGEAQVFGSLEDVAAAAADACGTPSPVGPGPEQPCGHGDILMGGSSSSSDSSDPITAFLVGATAPAVAPAAVAAAARLLDTPGPTSSAPQSDLGHSSTIPAPTASAANGSALLAEGAPVEGSSAANATADAPLGALVHIAADEPVGAPLDPLAEAPVGAPLDPLAEAPVGAPLDPLAEAPVGAPADTPAVDIAQAQGDATGTGTSGQADGAPSTSDPAATAPAAASSEQQKPAGKVPPKKKLVTAVILPDGVLSFQDSFELLLRQCSLAHYLVYSQLRYSGLAVVRHRPLPPAFPQPELGLVSRPLDPDFDVYANDGFSSFRQSAPGPPDFYVFIARSNERMPTSQELNSMQARLRLHAAALQADRDSKTVVKPGRPAKGPRLGDGRQPQLKCAVVSSTTVTFFGLACSGVPPPPAVPQSRRRPGQQ